MQQVSALNNPNLALNQLIMSNPNAAKAIEYIRNNGGDSQRAFYQLAKQMNIDPQEVLDYLKQ